MLLRGAPLTTPMGAVASAAAVAVATVQAGPVLDIETAGFSLVRTKGQRVAT